MLIHVFNLLINVYVEFKLLFFFVTYSDIKLDLTNWT